MGYLITLEENATVNTLFDTSFVRINGLPGIPELEVQAVQHTTSLLSCNGREVVRLVVQALSVMAVDGYDVDQCFACLLFQTPAFCTVSASWRRPRSLNSVRSYFV